MPEFIAQHVPAKLPRDRMPEGFDFAEFVRGYLECFEWLLPEPDGDPDGYGIDRAKIRGWSRDALRRIKADLTEYADTRRMEAGARGYSAEAAAGHDFYLSRENHGTGFWDRGLGELGSRLDKAAESHGEAGLPWLSRGWLRLD